ncbi:uncharacterized protein LOC114354866 isoform X2 [Ostrinia furnacalis]|uniref:uncharacterized protein LOC114354866 isoform X2 n=1 Tax=Ostrinia furnacalis TaxID=93504 RepID=UPI00103DB55D|nr:uncharacterized protein LOC114354866 isoform X2 [Ostrinia furnacalis]
MPRKTQRVVLNNQARDIISKVYDFMKNEAKNNYAEKLTDARWRTAQAAGVSESTVTRILREKRKKNTKPATESDSSMETDAIDAAVPITEITVKSEPTTETKVKTEPTTEISVKIEPTTEWDVFLENEASTSKSRDPIKTETTTP